MTLPRRVLRVSASFVGSPLCVARGTTFKIFEFSSLAASSTDEQFRLSEISVAQFICARRRFEMKGINLSRPALLIWTFLDSLAVWLDTNPLRLAALIILENLIRTFQLLNIRFLEILNGSRYFEMGF